MSMFTFVFLSEKLNAILETAVNTLDMSEFDESVFDTAVASQLSVEAGRLAVISPQLSPSLPWLSGGQFSIQSTSKRRERLRLEKVVEPLGVDYACSYASDVEKIKDTIKMTCDTADIEPVSWPGKLISV